MIEYRSLRPLQLSVLEDDPSLRQMIDGLFANSFAIFLVKIVQPLEVPEWKQVARTLESFVAGYIQNNRELLTSLGDPDIIWDIYLVFLTHGEISVEKKVELENDRFYCKKVVLPYHSERSLEEHLHELTLFQEFDHISQRDGTYLEKDAFVKQLLTTIENPRLVHFVTEHDLLVSDEKQLLARFRQEFDLEIGE